MAEVRDQMIVPTALPINAVIAIATAPHTVTRSAGLVACAPPTRAPMMPPDAEEPAAGNGRRDRVADAELVAAVRPGRVVGEEIGSRASRTLWLSLPA